MDDRPLIFVSTPYSGDIEGNTKLARDMCRLVYEAGGIPFAPHLLFPQFLKEECRKEREAGIALGIAMMGYCDIMVIRTVNDTTPGIRLELDAWCNNYDTGNILWLGGLCDNSYCLSHIKARIHHWRRKSQFEKEYDDEQEQQGNTALTVENEFEENLLLTIRKIKNDFKKYWGKVSQVWRRG